LEKFDRDRHREAGVLNTNGMALHELVFNRASVHAHHDLQRLEDGKDLNDALLDFFVKLGQALIPDEEKGPAVAYLGSHFYDVLRKGGVEDGQAGHKNVANWARRRLGHAGLFGETVGALAIPVNEVLRAGYEGGPESNERHWWLALLLNPKAAIAPQEGEDDDVSLLCLDSFVRAETKFDPVVRACKQGVEAYPVEVHSLSRIGFCVNVSFSSRGDGTAGQLAEPRLARLKAGGRVFVNTEMNLKARERGGDGKPGKLDGVLGFRLDRRGAAKTAGEYILEYGEPEEYQPPLKLRMGQKPTPFQAQVGRFIGGYLSKEYVTSSARKLGEKMRENGAQRLEEAICLPGVPQQETSHDCGFFILEQILRALQLTSEQLRELATASSSEIAMLPWPSQQQVFRRKAKLRDIMSSIFAIAKRTGTNDVEVMMKQDPKLRVQLRSALHDGCPSFTKGYERWAAGDWDLSPSPSPVRELSRSRDSSPAASSRSESSDRGKHRKKKKRRRRRSSSSSRSRSGRRERSSSKPVAAPPAAAGVAENGAPPVNAVKPGNAFKPTFTKQDLEKMGVGALRTLCIQHGVLPPGSLERSDLFQALTPLAVAPPAPSVHTPGVAVHTPGVRTFTRAELDAMPSKALKALCAEKGVLETGMMERSEFLKALTPLCS